MKKIIWIALFSLLGLELLHLWAYAAVEAVDVSQTEEFLRELDTRYGQYFGWKYFEELWYSEQGLDIGSFLTAMLQYMRDELKMNFAFSGKLLFLAVLSAILGNLEQAFGQGISKMARLTVFFLAAVLVMDEAKYLYEIADRATEQLAKFMDAVLPAELVLLFISGGVSAAGALEPLLFWVVNLSGSLAKNMLLPGIYFCLVLAIVNAMSDKYKLSQLQRLCKKVLLWSFAGINSILLLILSLSGVTASLADGLGFRGMKYIVGSVPIVGDMLANTAELTVSGAMLLKNGLGIIGLFIVIMLAFLPAVKILAASMLLKLTAALIEPLGEGMLSELFQQSGECFMLLFAAVMLVGLMFFLSTAVLTAVTQTVFMLR